METIQSFIAIREQPTQQLEFRENGVSILQNIYVFGFLEFLDNQPRGFLRNNLNGDCLFLE